MTIPSTPIKSLKKEAKRLFKQLKANNAQAIARVSQVLKNPSDISLMRIQHVIAVEHGFSKWEDLVKASEVDLHLPTKKESQVKLVSKRPVTPLGNMFRGPGIFPTSPHFAKLADMFDSMNLREQERYLDDDARRMGIFLNK